MTYMSVKLIQFPIGPNISRDCNYVNLITLSLNDQYDDCIRYCLRSQLSYALDT